MTIAPSVFSNDLCKPINLKHSLSSDMLRDKKRIFNMILGKDETNLPQKINKKING